MAEIIHLDEHRDSPRQDARRVMQGRARAGAPPNEREALEEAQKVLDREHQRRTLPLLERLKMKWGWW